MVEKDPFEAAMNQSRRIFSRLNAVDSFVENFVKSVAHSTLLFAYFFYAITVLLILFSPFLIKADDGFYRGIGALAYNLGYLTCHQLPYRSIFLNGVQLPVCARDTGFFIGLLLGIAHATWAKNVWKPLTSFKGLLISMLPLAVDGLAQTTLNLWESINPVRFASGFFLGFGCSVYILHKVFSRRKEIKQHFRRWENVLISAFTAALVYAIFLNATAAAVGGTYLSEKGAIAEVNKGGNAKTPVETYFIPPKTPLSLPFDPYIERHRDNIVDDLLSGKTGPTTAGECKTSPQEVFQAPPLNPDGTIDLRAMLKTLPNTWGSFLAIFNQEGNYGLWVVVIPDGAPRNGEGTYTKTSGEYYYIDAWTGKLLSRTGH